jgi:hypothetical protein
MYEAFTDDHQKMPDYIDRIAAKVLILHPQMVSGEWSMVSEITQ